MSGSVEVTRKGQVAVEHQNGEGAAQPKSLVHFAIERGLDADTIERLVALQERMEARSAEAAMISALAAFQEECPPIARSKTADAGTYTYDYAPFEEVARTVRPILAKHGLSFTHDARVLDGLVKVKCTLMHIAGAKRTATFTGPFDKSGGKNPIQTIASARSYGRRYSLIDVLGLATEGEDDDGQRAGTKMVSEQQAADLSALAEEVGADQKKFLQFMRVASFGEIPAKDYRRALNALESKRRAQ